LIANEAARVQGAGNQDQVGGAMVRALRQWLETHELPAIIAAVLGVVMTVSVLMVLVGYLVARQ
jgi:redox-regulated HSP33 family molecular chaperone